VAPRDWMAAAIPPNRLQARRLLSHGRPQLQSPDSVVDHGAV